MAKIVELKAENVMRLNVVEITPDGSLVVIGGNNSQGKSSVLNSIMYALGGAKTIPEKALREGAERGEIRIELDSGLIITRTFTASGRSSIKVTGKDGATFGSPQKILDRITGSLTFDPLKFTQLSAGDQAIQLRELVGVDFAEYDSMRTEYYAERTILNRKVKELESIVNAADFHDDLPVEEISVAELVVEHDAMIAANGLRMLAHNDIMSIERRKDSVTQKIKTLECELRELKEQRKELGKVILSDKKKYKNMPEYSESEIEQITEKLSNAEETNSQIRSNQKIIEIKAQLSETQNSASQITAAIKHIDKKKKETLAAADFPIEGLSFDENTVIYNDIPLSQASSAEQLRVSVAIGIALNPELKVILIRDGSLLDEGNLQLIRDMATDNDMQVWLECVGKGEECSVIIEDGRVVA